MPNPEIEENLFQGVVAAVRREREYQNAHWGTLDEHPHEVGGWITVMRKELREAEDAWCKNRGDDKALMEILQVVAVGFACLQQHGIIERPQVFLKGLQRDTAT